MFKAFTELTSQQRRAFFASLSGWSLDAFDFFIFVLCIGSISSEFHTTVTAVAEECFIRWRCGQSVRWYLAGWPRSSGDAPS